MLTGKRILLVEDDEADVIHIKANLINLHCEFEIASCLDEAIDRVATFVPDLVLLDVRIPKALGMGYVHFNELLDFVRLFKARHANVFLTGNVDPSQVDKAMLAGALDYIDKSRLLDRVEFEHSMEKAYLLHLSILAKQPEAQMNFSLARIEARQRAILGIVEMSRSQTGKVMEKKDSLLTQQAYSRGVAAERARWKRGAVWLAGTAGWIIAIAVKTLFSSLIHWRKD